MDNKELLAYVGLIALSVLLFGLFIYCVYHLADVMAQQRLQLLESML
jgi:hypothetical protein